jgi:hypothetical protein
MKVHKSFLAGRDRELCFGSQRGKTVLKRFEKTLNQACYRVCPSTPFLAVGRDPE